MANPHHHTVSSIRKFKLYGPDGFDDYSQETYDAIFKIHFWFDETKQHLPDFRHRALRHHAEGIFLCEKVNGAIIALAGGKKIPTRWIAEQHVKEDLGFIPTAADWLRELKPVAWMARSKKLSIELDQQEQLRADGYDEWEEKEFPSEHQDNEQLLEKVNVEPVVKKKSFTVEF